MFKTVFSLGFIAVASALNIYDEEDELPEKGVQMFGGPFGPPDVQGSISGHGGPRGYDSYSGDTASHGHGGGFTTRQERRAARRANRFARRNARRRVRQERRAQRAGARSSHHAGY